MKHALRFAIVFSLFFLLLSSGKPAKKSPIFGTWRIAVGNHNGVSAPKSSMDRLQYFNRDNTFKSVVANANGTKSNYNHGVFYVLNDTTIVAYQADMYGKLVNIANTYNFHIKNDTMHFYGYFLRLLSNTQPTLMKVFIDEWWVREK